MKFKLTVTTTTVLILLAALTSCKKHNHRWNIKSNEKKHDVSTSHDRNDHKTDSKNKYSTRTTNKFIDFRGDVRKKFAMTAVSRNPQISLICSPISAWIPLGKLTLGAEGRTQRELLKAIGVNHVKEIDDHFTKRLNYMKKIEGSSYLSIASRIYLSDKKYLMSSFKSNAEEIFKSSIEMVDMRNPVAVANSVNDWVSKQTRGYIKELIKASDLSSDASLLLVNAVYFKGLWKTPFTSEQFMTFYGASGERSVPMMQVTDHFEHGVTRTLGSDVLLMPYDKGDVSMMIILPKERKGLTMLLNQLRLAPELINSRIRYTKKEMKLYVPRFKIESDLDLKDLYEKIGLDEITSRKLGFTSIVRDETVYISKAKQKAVIDVSLNGTTAAAATASVNLGSAIPANLPVFKADHPFLFFILASREQIFAGIYT